MSDIIRYDGKGSNLYAICILSLIVIFMALRAGRSKLIPVESGRLQKTILLK